MTDKKRKTRLRRFAYSFVSWSGLIVLGVIAVPAAILVVIIFTVQEVLDRILKKINEE